MIRTIIPLFAILLTCAAPTLGLTAEEIVAKNLDARGGVEQLQAITSIKATGTIKVPGGTELPLVIFRRDPNLFRQETSFNNISRVLVFDGENAWQSMPLAGKQMTKQMHPADAARIKAQSDFDGLLIDYTQRGLKLEKAEETELDSIPVYHLNLTDGAGTSIDIYLDHESFLEKGMTISSTGDNEPAYQLHTVFDSFTTVSGLKLPNAITVIAQDRVAAELAIDKFDINMEMPDSLFQQPAGDNTEGETER
jgi:outer membrane lipoprotein-sorting protein